MMLKPMTVGQLKKKLKFIPDTARVVLLSDEEGNSLHHLYTVTVDNTDKPTAVYLQPAGEELEDGG